MILNILATLFVIFKALEVVGQVKIYNATTRTIWINVIGLSLVIIGIWV